MPSSWSSTEFEQKRKAKADSIFDRTFQKGLKPRYTVSGEKYILNVVVCKDTVLKYWLGKGTETSEIEWLISYIIGQLHIGEVTLAKWRVCPCSGLSAFTSCCFVPLTKLQVALNKHISAPSDSK